MKKYIFRYIFIIVIMIVLYFLKNNQPTLLLSEFDDYLDKGIIDGLSGTYFLLVANMSFSIILSLVTATTTIAKENKVKFKYLIATAIILTLFFIFPIIKLNYFGGIEGGTGEKFISIFTYIQQLFN